jgi:predicted alpha/beta-fold hydrolase
VTENIPVHQFSSIPGVVFMQTSHGNHFGFVEGPLIEVFSSDYSYTYPAKVAVTYFETVGNRRRVKDVPLN